MRKKSVFFAKPEEVDPERNVIATYYVESELPVPTAGEQIAIEESIGTWTEVTTTRSWIREKLPAKVFKWEGDNEGAVSVAYPNELFDVETGGVPNILSIIAGNLFGLSALKNVRLLDVDFPEEIIGAFPGPKFGIEALRKMAGTQDEERPHLGTIIKPKVGLNPKQTAEVAYEAAMGGVDFIKDDETLTDQKFCPLRERVAEVMVALDKVKEETGKNTFYAANITSNVGRMMGLAEAAIEHGANMLMVDVLTAGFSAVQMLADDPSIKVPLHIHRTMHGAITRNPRHGIHMMVITKLVRMVGGDQLHTGTAAGKMEKTIAEVRRFNDFLRGAWHGLRTVFPVASGGIHPGLVPFNIDKLGEDLVINAGGGIHGHPNGTRAGARAMRQAIEASTRNIPLEKYAETHKELSLALKSWGYKYLTEE